MPGPGVAAGARVARGGRRRSRGPRCPESPRAFFSPKAAIVPGNWNFPFRFWTRAQVPVRKGTSGSDRHLALQIPAGSGRLWRSLCCSGHGRSPRRALTSSGPGHSFPKTGRIPDRDVSGPCTKLSLTKYETTEVCSRLFGSAVPNKRPYPVAFQVEDAVGEASLQRHPAFCGEFTSLPQAFGGSFPQCGQCPSEGPL